MAGVRNRARRILLSLSAVLVLSGCGQEALELQTHDFDEELSRYRNEFYDVAAARGRDGSLAPTVMMRAARVTTDSGEPAAAVCERGGIIPVVTVDSLTWPALSKIQKRGLVFHELGHCLLERSHKEDLIPGKACPVSLMASSLPLQSCLDIYAEEYEEELFDGG